MRGLLSCAILASLSVSACQDPTGPPPEYRPEEAGTVDHAMCLLGFEAVPLREVATGHHLVQAKINGRSGSFVLDTGANVTVVENSHLRHFDISGSQGGLGRAVGGMAGGMRARQVAIDGLKIGSIKTRQARIVTTDLGQLLSMLGQVSGTTVYGLVGQDVLKEHRAIVDVAKPMLYLIPQDRDPAPVAAAKCKREAEAKGGA
ncbi:retropepsin-like aspartic protease [Sphingomonas sp.]|uniref:retropepsin-like aspartic protease n=1 Tax=Sphingomonas sp. TaxID=28214 RepID=UPI0017B858A4|nr:retropepsin-like aspartic protease [Sphingomonas sp.]MBA3510759.1 clan AA aspartic protease [Sphingomonas sp.]